MDTVGLFEMRRPSRCEINSGSYKCYWSSMEDDTRLRGGTSNRLQLFMVEVTIVECIMRVKMRHIVDYISLVAEYAPAEMCEAVK